MRSRLWKINKKNSNNYLLALRKLIKIDRLTILLGIHGKRTTISQNKGNGEIEELQDLSGSLL
jgi:hypothetical protein